MKRSLTVVLGLTATTVAAAANVTVRPADDGRALCNPDCGWAMHYYDNGSKYGSFLGTGDDMSWYPSCNVVYLRLPWSWLEPEEGVYNWQAIDTPAQQWIDRGGQVAFRITVSETMPEGATPKWMLKSGAKIIRWTWREGPKPDGKNWECAPDDPVFLEKFGNFLKAFAARYDGRREVAFVDVGSLGIWGEGHTARTIRLSETDTDRIARLHTELHLKHFRKTPVVVNDDFTIGGRNNASSPMMDWALARGLAWRDDSILVGNPNNKEWPGQWWYHEKQGRAFSEKAPVVIEFGHYQTLKNWGNWNLEKLVESVENHRASYLSIHGEARRILDENRDVVETLARRIGYRFQAREITYPSVVRAGADPKEAAPFSVSFAFANAGAAPCYRDAFPCLTLKTAAGGIAAVLADGDFNLRTLEPAAPGKAKPKTHVASFTLGRWQAPALPPNEYEVFVSVGERDGTPVYELPMAGDDGKRRYRIGKIRVSSPGGLADVDPFFGSGGSTAAPSEGMARGWNWEKAQTGNTHPGAVVPFGWVSACGYSGGYSSGYGRFGCSGCGYPPEKLKELTLFGFTHFHHNGAGWIGAFLNYCLFTPSAAGAATDKASSVRNETASPGYYAAELVDYGAAFELTTDRFAACHRYRFPKGDGRVRVDLTAAGYRCEIFGGRPKYRESVTDLAVTQSVDGIWSGYIVACGRPRYFGLSAAAAASANVVTNGVLELTFRGTSASTAIGFSDVSADEAVARARAAADKGFDAMRAAAVRAWTDAFGGIRAEFADVADRKRFYSALYHSLQKPVEYRPGRFVEFSTTWDTYRAQLPLAFSFAAPTARTLALSLLATSEELGYFPNTYLLCKRPSHNDNQATALGVYVLADACFRGLLHQDEYPRVKAFMSREFADADISRRSVTHVLDVAGAYCAAAFAAEQFGDADAAKGWRKEANMWRRAYDPKTGLLPKSANFYEGDERNYSFRPHVGMNGRVALAAGTERFETMLNDFFAVDGDFAKWSPQHDRQRRPGHFEGLNNECDMNTPLSWFWAGRADRVCEVHDLIRRCRFSDGPGAIPGNNDGGGTSAWYVWSCLGLYPLSGAPYVFLVSPTVERAKLAFAGGGNLTVEVERKNPKAIYPSEIVFNGRRLEAPWLTVSGLQKGGRLVFRMSEKPMGRSPVPTWL